MTLKIFGYCDSTGDELLELRQATLCVAGPAEALALSQFFAHCAHEMETNAEWDHVHFSGGRIPDLILAKIRE